LPLPFSIQWRHDGILLPDETNSVLTIADVRSMHAGRYSVTATQPELQLSVTPAAATLVGPVLITRHPQPQGIPRGGNASLQVTADGAPPMSYRWLFNGAEIAGATNASLLITNAQLAQDGLYSVVVSNSYGSVSSSPASLAILVRPVLSLHPVSQS